jgi:hypothetical protein
VLCKTRPMGLRGVAVVELEQAAESLTTLRLACSDHRNVGRDQRVAQALVRPFFMIMVDKFSHGSAGRKGPCSRQRSQGVASLEYSSTTTRSGWASRSRAASREASLRVPGTCWRWSFQAAVELLRPGHSTWQL